MSLTTVFPLVVVFQSLSCALLFLTWWTAACQALLSSPISWSLINFLSFESVMLSNYLILCYPLLILSSFFLSIKVFYNESAIHIEWPKYWSFSFSNNVSNENSGLISFRIDCFDLLTVQGTLKNSYPTPQSKVINSLVLSLLYGPALTCIHDYWKNHQIRSDQSLSRVWLFATPWIAAHQASLSLRFDYTNLC